MSVAEQGHSSESSIELERLRKNFGANGIYSMTGTGVDFRGKNFSSAEDKAAGIALRTRWIIVLWVPLIPLGSYRIRMHRKRVNQRGQYVQNFELVSKEPLSGKQVLRVWLVSAVAVGLVFLLMNWVTEG